MRFDDKKCRMGVNRLKNNASTVAARPMTLKRPIRERYAKQKKI